MAEAKNSITQAEALQREILTLREKAERVATELLHRAQARLDVRAQIRAQRGPIIGVTVGVVVVMASVTMYKIERARRERTLRARMRRKWQALATIVREPEMIVGRTRRHRPDLGRVFTAILVTGATLALKLMAKHAVEPRLAVRHPAEQPQYVH